MATTINNQASVTYQYGTLSGTATSNIASTVLADAFAVDKQAITATYQLNSRNTYSISVTNNSSVTATNVNIIDNLGTYSITETTATPTPLDFISPASLYINGVFSSTITPSSTTATSITFVIPSLAPATTATIVIPTTTNNTAPLDTGSTITNIATVTATDVDAITDTAQMTVNDFADVRIIKTMEPTAITEGNTVTYTFTIYNYGNTDATNIVLTDAFERTPTITNVTLNGDTIAPSNYSLTGNVFQLPASGASYPLTVPAATFTRDSTTGVVTATPESIVITVTGTI